MTPRASGAVDGVCQYFIRKGLPYDTGSFLRRLAGEIDAIENFRVDSLIVVADDDAEIAYVYYRVMETKPIDMKSNYEVPRGIKGAIKPTRQLASADAELRSVGQLAPIEAISDLLRAWADDIDTIEGFLLISVIVTPVNAKLATVPPETDKIAISVSFVASS